MTVERALGFRNVEVPPGMPVDAWPYEAVVATIERGTIGNWLVLTRSIDADPWGPVARQVEEYLGYEQPYGVGPLLERAVSRAREQQRRRERDEVTAEVRRLVEESGLSLTDLASRLGTSRTRLSTYRTGTVVPAATLMVRLRRVVNRLHGGPR